MEIRNNRAERSIKSYVIDRKNFLFANTPGGATGSAVMFSLIMTALENKLDPWRYFTRLMKIFDTVKDVEELLPWKARDFFPSCVNLRNGIEYKYHFGG